MNATFGGRGSAGLSNPTLGNVLTVQTANIAMTEAVLVFCSLYGATEVLEMGILNPDNPTVHETNGGSTVFDSNFGAPPNSALLYIEEIVKLRPTGNQPCRGIRMRAGPTRLHVYADLHTTRHRVPHVSKFSKQANYDCHLGQSEPKELYLIRTPKTPNASTLKASFIVIIL
jgi:hypothetical protein